MSTESDDMFMVRVEPENWARGFRWRVSLTRNGYQWQSLGVEFADKAKAERVADFLLRELAPEAARMAAEIEALVEVRSS